MCLRGAGRRTDPQIKTMSADDMRNTVIVEVGAQTGKSGSALQAPDHPGRMSARSTPFW